MPSFSALRHAFGSSSMHIISFPARFKSLESSLEISCAPKIIHPDWLFLLRSSFPAMNPPVRPASKTVIIINRKTKALSCVPSKPCISSSYTNKDATAAATIPLGAIQDSKSFCFKSKPLFSVPIKTDSGLIKKISINTVKTPAMPRSIIC